MADPAPISEEEEAPALVEAEEPATAEKLDAAISDAMVQYGLKNYDAAADLFATAAEIQDKLRGEMDPQNAELLYLYGRCLYHVAVAKSDVLGGKVVGKEKKEKKPKAQGNGEGSAASAPPATKEEKLAGEVVEAAVEAKDGAPPAEQTKSENKPYFQFTEEADSDDDDDEDGEGDGDAGDEDEEDDFANAFEILDLARVLLQRQLQALDANAALSNGKAAAGASKPDPAARKLKERLSDTHDLVAEISLENERYHDAIPDFRAALALKQELYAQDDSIIAEAHYKLGLALEFASVTAIREAQAQESDGNAPDPSKEPPQVDEELRREAATQLEAAIASCQLRVQAETAELASAPDDEAKDTKRRQIEDVEGMVAEMQTRLQELRAEPAAAALPPSFAGLADDPGNPLTGILGQILGESAGEQKRRVEEATKTANDLTGLVKRKKAGPAAPAAAAAADTGGKRKLDDGGGEEAQGKRAKTEEAP